MNIRQFEDVKGKLTTEQWYMIRGLIEDNKRLSALLEHQREEQEKQQELLKQKIDKLEYLHIRLDRIEDRLRLKSFTLEDIYLLFEIQQEAKDYDY